jgi:hypothetical protein
LFFATAPILVSGEEKDRGADGRGRKNQSAGAVDNLMTHSFKNWLSFEELSEFLQLLEVSALFDREGYNRLFSREIERLKQEFPGYQRQLALPPTMDWVGYIAKSLRNAGFRDHDIDPFVHEIAVRLLVSPGGLFSKWDGQPIAARFKVAVRNAVLNLVQKRSNHRKNMPSISIHRRPDGGPALQDELPARSATAEGEAIQAFRELVKARLGSFALALLDARLAGQDVKSLVGSPEFKQPSAYRLKLAIQAIKKLAEEFARQRHDESFLWQVRRAMAADTEIVQRRVVGSRPV